MASIVVDELYDALSRNEFRKDESLICEIVALLLVLEDCGEELSRSIYVLSELPSSKKVS
jgi:hypothetical protein